MPATAETTSPSEKQAVSAEIDQPVSAAMAGASTGSGAIRSAVVAHDVSAAGRWPISTVLPSGSATVATRSPQG